MRSKSVVTLEGVSAFALYSSMAVGSKYNLPEPQSIIAKDIYDQHIMLMWICLAIFVAGYAIKTRIRIGMVVQITSTMVL